MESKKEIIKTNKYNQTYSYLRIIMEVLSKNNTAEELLISEIFNSEVSNIDESEFISLCIYSALFENKLFKMDINKRQEFANDLYETYIKSMIINYSNENYTMVDMFYRALNEQIKVISGFYGIYGDNYSIKQYQKII